MPGTVFLFFKKCKISPELFVHSKNVTMKNYGDGINNNTIMVNKHRVVISKQ